MPVADQLRTLSFTPVDIYVCGGLALTDRTRLVTSAQVPGPLARVALAALALSHVRPVSSIELADVLWTGEPPDAWRTSLRAIISRTRTVLRDLLGRDELVLSGEGWYRLALPPGSSVDLLTAEASIHTAEARAQSDGARAAAGDAVVASMIASRPVLPDVDHPWVESLRRRAERVRTRALEVLVRVHLELGDYAMVEADANRLIEAEPLRETAYEVLMMAHLAQGNAALGLRVYERCRRRLAEQLGASPGPTIEAVYQRLLALT